MTESSRRAFLRGLAALPAVAFPGASFSASKAHFEGIFPIMQSPFTASGALDTEALARQVQFLDRIGVQGMVWPQLASEYQALKYEERLAGAEAVVRAAKGLKSSNPPAVVIGVQAPDTETAVKYARHAQTLAPDAIIAIPLDGGKGDESKQIAYYTAIAEACDRPLMVQTLGDMSVDLVLRMAKQIPALRYVKDEAGATLPRISDYRSRGRGLIHSVFTGAHGRTLIDELARGSGGTMPAAGFGELYVAVWKLWQSGKRDQAMEMFGRTLLLISQVQAYGLPGMKYVLQLRGVFPNTVCRLKSGPALDEDGRKSIEMTVRYLRPWLRASSGWTSTAANPAGS